MSLVHFIATYADELGVHHEKGITVTAASRNAGWRKALGVALAAGSAPAGWNLIFMRWESLVPHAADATAPQ
jgi:hypothetical protein